MFCFIRRECWTLPGLWDGGGGGWPWKRPRCRHNPDKWRLQGKPAPALAQPLWGHILPALPTASICECLIWSASVAECGILFIPDLIPEMCTCMPTDAGNGILLVTVTRVTGLHCRLQRHTLTQVKKGGKCCIWYLFVPCLREGKKDFSHVNEGRVAVFWVMRLRASKPHTKWENEICHLWQSEPPCCLLCLW